LGASLGYTIVAPVTSKPFFDPFYVCEQFFFFFEHLCQSGYFVSLFVYFCLKDSIFFEQPLAFQGAFFNEGSLVGFCQSD